MPAVVLNNWTHVDPNTIKLTVTSGSVGSVSVLVDAEIAPHLYQYRWGYDAKTQRFSYSEAYTRVYLHRKIAELYEKKPVATVNMRDRHDLRKANMLWRVAG